MAERTDLLSKYQARIDSRPSVPLQPIVGEVPTSRNSPISAPSSGSDTTFWYGRIFPRGAARIRWRCENRYLGTVGVGRSAFACPEGMAGAAYGQRPNPLAVGGAFGACQPACGGDGGLAPAGSACVVECPERLAAGSHSDLP